MPIAVPGDYVTPSLSGVKLAVDAAKRATAASEAIAAGTATKQDLDDFMLFSPFALEDVDQELVMLGAVGVGLYLSKTDRGMKLLETMVKEYFGTIKGIIGDVARGSSTHMFSSMTAQMMTMRMLRRLGLITNAEANTIHHEIIWTINKIIAQQMVGDISHAVGTVFGGAGTAILAGVGAGKG